MMARVSSSSPERNVILMMTFGVMVVAAIVAAIRQKRTVEARSLELQMLAGRLKFDDFNPNRNEAFAGGWGFLNRLAQGTERYAFNILRGMYHEQALFVFDYHYQTGSGKNKEEHNCTFLIAAAFGVGNEIKFESAEFSRKFCVRSPDKKFAYDVCNPQMIECLLANPGLQIEIQGPVLLLAFEPQLPVGQIELNLQRLIEIRSCLPDYLFTTT